MRRRFWGMLVILGLILAFSGVTLAGNWPVRPIKDVVYSAAGGATDLSNRAISEAIKKYLGVDVSVVNMPGAMGGTAEAYVWNAPHNGYLWFGTSEGFLGQCVLGISKQTVRDWEFFMIAGTPGIISVSKGSKYRTLEQLLKDVKANPDKITVATSIPGCIWNIQYLTLKKFGGYNMKFVPYKGSHPSQIAALNGEVDVVWTGLGEQAEYLKAGQLRPLAIYDTKALTFAGKDIPPITKFVPSLKKVMPIKQFVGFALPVDTPKEILIKIEKAFKKAMKDKPVKDYAKTKYSELYGYTGKKAKEVATKEQQVFAWLLWETGIAKKSPKEFGIPRPSF